MNDTSPEVERRYHAMLLERSPEARLLMGDSMYAAARALVRASILAATPNASPAQLRQQIFLRFYGHEFDAPARDKILAALVGATRSQQDAATMAHCVPPFFRPFHAEHAPCYGVAGRHATGVKACAVFDAWRSSSCC
jgi:hypothetical protein